MHITVLKMCILKLLSQTKLGKIKEMRVHGDLRHAVIYNINKVVWPC